MASSYKLRCALFGHEKDVRAVCNSYFPEGSIISASRDVTTRLWTPDEADGSIGFSESHTMSGHSNFVVAVCVMPPDERYPHGLIMTGSNDNNIHAYSLESPQPQYKLQGHTNTVCSLASGKFGSLLSGSWDTTAKVWLNQKCVMTLSGHTASVWAVAIMPEGGFMLTASADKTCRLWRAGKCERTYKGHDDCVRGLAVLSSTEFLSCGNDATIRRWLVSGECTHVYYGHNNYVYSISILPNGEDFVTGGEDRSLRVWKNGECVQTLPHPTESVWSVCALPNGDIATGASDGVVRVFSSNPARQADEGIQKAFEEQVASSTISTELGDIKPENLQGPEALFNPGKKDGQTLMVREENNTITAHQWSAAEGRWVKVGDVVGSKGGQANAGGKTNFMGKDYDYVFSVEIEEGKPPLKLPFNIGDDPWMAAHKFLERNDMSPLFLDQVAKFIVEQTKGVSIGQAQPPQVSDPFTGGGRYIPGSTGAQNGNPNAPAFGADPFTGSGSYIPGSSDAQNGITNAPAFGADPFTGSGSYKPAGFSAPAPTTNNLFPQTSYLFFENANPAAILGKLREFNNKVDQPLQLQENEITELEPLMSGTAATSKQLETLWRLLQWPPASVFPAVDVLRLSVRGNDANQHFFNTKDGPGFLSHLLAIINNESVTANQMLVLRSLCNALKHNQGETLLLAERDRVISGVLDSKPTGNKNVEVAFSTLLLNYSVAATRNNDIEAKSQLLSAAITQIQMQNDAEANYRLLVSLGTLVSNDDNCIAMALSLGAEALLDKFTCITTPPKVPECARLVKQALK